MTDGNFYRAFEDRYRGTRELIKSRLTIYLPFILPLKQFYGACEGVDLGCGRGEWLELMRENGIDVQGIDLDQGMLDAARERGLKVAHGDATEYLQTLAPESLAFVSGFHIAEHLPFELLQTIIQQSLRVLKPGGLLILETPNPENIIVGTTNFYFDPTHQRPIPPLLLSFMVEHIGFATVKTLRLQEPAGLAESNSLTLLSVLNGVSPDYAVVAQKGGDKGIVDATAGAFEEEHGLTLESLANSYDQQIKARVQRSEAAAQQAESKAQQAESKAQQAESKAQQAISNAVAQEQRAIAAEARVMEILSSTSWRISAPLRMIANAARRIVHLPQVTKLKAKEQLKLLLAHARLYINRRPTFRRFALAALRRFPALGKRMRQTTYALRPATPARRPGAVEQAHICEKLESLPPRARQIYVDLEAAKFNRGKEGGE